MAYVPPWRKRQMELESKQEPIVKKPRFLGNVLGGPDVQENTGKRYTPRSPGALPTGRIIRQGPAIQPNTSPILTPTHDLQKLQPKFRKKVLHSMRTLRKKDTKVQKRKGAGKGKGTGTGKRKGKSKKTRKVLRSE